MADLVERAKVPVKVPYFTLECGAAFGTLSEQEKLYAHYMSHASWWGYPISATQVSEESLPLIQMFLTMHLTSEGIESLKSKSASKGVSDEEFEWFLQYAALVFSSAGNYNSFGDSKFLPRLDKEKFKTIVECSESDKAISLMNSVLDLVYEFAEKYQNLGLGDKGVSTYYSSNFTEEDASFISAFMEKEHLSPYNTRVFKTEKDGAKSYEIRKASAEVASLQEFTYEGVAISVTTGDYTEYMTEIVKNLTKAKEYAANDTQREMIACYIKSFAGGSIDDHKDSQRFWIKDQGPAVETNLGFIESYRDPAGVRGEWEGMVAVVDKEQSKVYASLVENAVPIIAQLPWPKDFEKDTFNKPDFTALKVVTFASSGTPLGINIPNYDDIRQNEGFKNVYLENVGAAKNKDPLSFISLEDSDRINNCAKVMEVHVALHELLGHGSGKLLSEDKEGKKNFQEGVINPVTGAPVTTWYKAGETWDSKFGSMASSYEECRAECAGLYLCMLDNVTDLWGLNAEEKKEVIFTNYASFARMGLMSLEYYNPGAKKWGQAHMQARFGIFRTLLDAGVYSMNWKEGDDDALVTINEDLIATKGKEAIGNFLMKINVFKAIADVESATSMYISITTPPEEWLALRELVIAKRQPRKQLIQAHTELVDGQVKVTQWEGNCKNQIISFTQRFKHLFSQKGE